MEKGGAVRTKEKFTVDVNLHVKIRELFEIVWTNPMVSVGGQDILAIFSVDKALHSNTFPRI